MKRPIQWATASNETRGTSANGSRLVNLYAEALPPDSKTPVALYGTPGTEVFTALGTNQVKALHVMNEKLYAVTATRLYEVRATGGKTDLGALDLSGRVSIANNGFDLVMVDGKKGYAYTPGTGLRQIVDPAFYPADTVTFQDGYLIFNRAGTGQFFLTNLQSLTFDASKFATAEGDPDSVVAVISNQRELWVMGPKSIEVWYNSGDPDFPFERMQGAFIEKGVRAPYSVAKMEGAVFWLGNDESVHMAFGYAPQKISTHGMEQQISGNNSDAFAYTYQQEGHYFYVLTFPTKNMTWVYDMATGLWHERGHYIHGRHHSNCYVFAHGKHLVGDFQNDRIYSMDLDIYKDDTDPCRRVARTPFIHANRQRVTMNCLELDMDSGIGLVTGQGEDPQAMMRWSDDGKTWSNEHWASIGKIGKYLTRVIWNRLGSFRQRQYEVVITDPVPVVIVGAYAEVENGRS